MFSPVIKVEISNQDGGLTVITDLDMSFTITKTAGKEENTLSLQIFNLSDTVKNRISKDNGTILLRAGYEDEMPLQIIFKGDICFTQLVVQKPERVFTIEALDGNKLLKATKAVYSFKSGSTGKQILNYLIKNHNIKMRSDIDLLPILDKQYLTGSNFNGILLNALNNICSDLNLKWSIQNGLLVFWDKKKLNGTLKGRIYLSKDTGLIGSPEEVKIKDEETSSSSSEEGSVPKNNFRKGWQITSLLHPSIEPGSIITVSSLKFTNTVIVRAVDVNHTGSNIAGGENVTSFTSEVYNE